MLGTACFALLCTIAASAQTVSPATDDLRRNLEEATLTSALETEGTPPFRLEASFDTFDYLGKPDGSGTLVEEWFKPGVSRRVITYRGLTWTQVAQGGSTRQSGVSFKGSFMEDRVIHALLQAGPGAKWIKEGAITYQPLTIGTIELDCVVLARLAVNPKNSGRLDSRPSSFCLSRNPRLIRLLHEQYDLSLTWNRFAKLGEHTVGQDVLIQQHGHPRANIHVTSFAAMHTWKESDFALPVGPDTSAEDLRLPDEAAGGEIVKKISPRYPDDAKQDRISGDVTLNILIDKAGKVERLEVIAAPAPSLARASMEAVRQWTYKPHLVNGEPTEVEATVVVHFAFMQ